MKLREILQHLIDGPWTWPGGYPLYFVLEDGSAASFAGVQADMKWVARAAISPDRYYSQWRIVGVDINWEDIDLICALTTKRIPSAYAD